MIAATACGSGESAVSDAEVDGALQPTSFVVPLDEPRARALEGLDRLSHVSRVALTACLAAEGSPLDAEPPPFVEPYEPPLLERWSRPAEIEARLGVGPRAWDGSVQGEPESDAWTVETDSRLASDESFVGAYEKCDRQVSGAEYQSAARLAAGEYNYFASELSRKALERVENSSAFKEANGKWQDCMRPKGYEDENELELVDRLMQERQGDEPGPAELKAVADLHECDKETGNRQAMYRVIVAEQLGVLADNPSALDEFDSRLDRIDEAIATYAEAVGVSLAS